MGTKGSVCPVLTGIPCPQGQKAADACLKRLDDDFNPVENIQDFLILNCALTQAEKIISQKQKV